MAFKSVIQRQRQWAMFFGITLVLANSAHAAEDPISQIYDSINNLVSQGLVESNSEYVASARGLFEHFEYNRMIGKELVTEGNAPAISLVKIGSRDFGNGNIYSNYFIQAAFTPKGATEPKYILSAYYLAASVQALEGTVKPWYMMDAKKVDAALAQLAAAGNFNPVAKTSAAFSPVNVVKNAGWVEEKGNVVYDGRGVTATPIYGGGGEFFLVTWGTTVPGSSAPGVKGAIVDRAANGDVRLARLDDVTDFLSTPLDAIQAASSPDASLDDGALQSYVLGLSTL